MAIYVQSFLYVVEKKSVKLLMREIMVFQEKVLKIICDAC